MAEKILISGASGLLGSHLLVKLLENDRDIIAMYKSETSKEEVFKVASFYGLQGKWDNIIWEKCDVLDVQGIHDLMLGVDQVYHCAALVSFNPSNAVQLHKINVEGTKNMVNAALTTGVKKFVHVSSTATIGESGNGEMCTEKSIWDNDNYHTYYAKSKYSSEREVWRGIEEGLDAVIVNPCVIIGPGSPDKSSGTMFSTIADGLKFYTEGANAFVDARDVASIMIQLMHSEINNERFLVIGENMKFQDLFILIANEMDVKAPSIKASKWMTSIAWRMLKIASLFSNKEAKITSESARASHKTTLFSNEKIKEYVEFEFTPIDEAVKNAVNYLQVNRSLR